MRRLSGGLYQIAGATLDTGHPLARGLVGCWLVNEGSGVRGFNLAQPMAGTWTDPVWQNGDQGPYLAPNGSTTALDTGLDVPYRFGTGGFTIVQRLRRPADTGVSITIGKHTGGAYYWCGIFGSSISMDPGNGNPYNTGLGDFSDSLWHWAAWVRRASTIYLYRDGQERYSFSYGGTIDGSGNLFLDQFGSDGGFSSTAHQGPTYIWNRGLSVEEIRELYVEPYGFLNAGPRIVAFVPPAPTGHAPIFQGSIFGSRLIGGVS